MQKAVVGVPQSGVPKKTRKTGNDTRDRASEQERSDTKTQLIAVSTLHWDADVLGGGLFRVSLWSRKGCVGAHGVSVCWFSTERDVRGKGAYKKCIIPVVGWGPWCGTRVL